MCTQKPLVKSSRWSALVALSLGLGSVFMPWGGMTRQAQAQCDPEPCWPKVNNGNYLDAGWSLRNVRGPLTSYKTGTGELLYFFSDQVGAVVGRLTSDLRWELWSQDGWSNTPDTVATAIDHSYGRYSNIKLYDYPGCPAAILGVAPGSSAIGGYYLDVHGYYVNFIHDPTGACFPIGFSQWRSGTTYDPLFFTNLIQDWEGPFRQSFLGGDFAFDPVSRSGILVGTFGMRYAIDFYPQLTATLFDLDHPTQAWRRWHRPSRADLDPLDPDYAQWCDVPSEELDDFWTGPGDWHTDNSWPRVHNSCMRARPVYILNSDEEITNVHHREPRITHIPGTGNFLVTFRYAESPPADASLKAAYYLDASDTACTTDADCPANTKCGEQVSGYCPRAWLWWSDTGWKEGGLYDYKDIITDNVLHHYDDEVRPQLYWEAGKVVNLVNANGTLVEVTYDDQAQAFTSETLTRFQVRPGGDYPDYRHYLPFSAVAVDSDNTLWLAYTDDTDATLLKLTYKRTGMDQWADATTIYTSPTEAVSPVGINFIERDATEELIVFLVEVFSDDSLRLSAVAENAPFCTGGDCLALDPKPEPVLLSPAELAPEREMPSYHLTVWGSLGIDDDAYVYAPSILMFKVIVFPPTYSVHTDVRVWGAPFWTFRQPSGVAVDRVREKVYIASHPFCGEGTASLSTCGRVRIWDTNRRDLDVDLCERTACSFSGEHVDLEYFDTVLHRGYDPAACSESMDSFGWPGDVSVDEDRGLLYVTNSLKNKIDVFDLEDLEDDPTPFGRAGLFEQRISCETSCNLDTVSSLVDELITAGYLVDLSGDMLAWNSAYLEEDVIPFLKSHALYQDLYSPESEDDEHDFIRNVRRHYKERHDHPCHWYSFGLPGEGAGEFMFPMGNDVDQDGNLYVVDSENHRVQKWVINEYNMLEFGFSWGSLGHGPGEFLYPFGLAVDDAYDRVYVTDPNNGRVQVFDKDGYFLHEFGAWETTETTRSVNAAFGIVADERGSIYMGFYWYPESGIVQLSVPDGPPDVVIDSPEHCAILAEGSNDVLVSTFDDWGIERIVLAVEGSGADDIVCEKDNDWTPCEEITDGFRITWELDLAGGPPQAGVIRVTLYDVIGQEALHAVHVVLGGQDQGPDNDGDGTGDLCDNCLGHSNPDQGDCDHDAIGDLCEILEGGSSDCNENGVPDECDIFDPSIGDCNENGIPDDCEPYEDCNTNGAQDICDIALETSEDCDLNGLPDECTPARLFVHPDGDTGNRGTSWGDAYNELYRALETAICAGGVSEIWVAAGTYYPGALGTFPLINGVAVYGGFAGGEATVEQRDPAVNITILFGGGSPVVTASATDATARLDGFTISSLFPATAGGGILCEYASPVISNCIIVGNSATYMGGGMYSNAGGATLINCIFAGNTCTGCEGGGIYVEGGTLTLVNCVFTGNGANWGSGGGLRNIGADVTLTNCSFSGNSAAVTGGGIYSSGGTMTVLSSVLWGNSSVDGSISEQQITMANGTATVDYSCIEGGWTGSGDPATNIDEDPLFVDPDGADNVIGTTDDNLRISIGSPCVNTGKPYLEHIDIPPDWPDIDGNARIINGRIDMGVHEFNVIFVDETAQGDNTGVIWEHAYPELKVALWAADVGAEIWVAAGTYTPFVGSAGNPREASFALENRIGLYGGFAGSETERDQRDPEANQTILSGDVDGDDVANLQGFLACYSGHNIPYVDGCSEFDVDEDLDVDEFDGNIDDNSFHVVTAEGVDSTAVIDGFTITAGSTGDNSDFGGGLKNHGGSPRLANCRFVANRAQAGGGMSSRSGGTPALHACTFEGNVAKSSGGGFELWSSPEPISLVGCAFVRNIAAGGEGGGLVSHAVTDMTDCVFLGNSAHTAGGGMSSDLPATLTNCLFSGNSSSNYAGGLLDFSGDIILTNCTFSRNEATLGYGGGLFTDCSNPTLTNCILWGNRDSGTDLEAAQIGRYLASPSVGHSCVEGWSGALGGVGNTGDDPQLVSGAGADEIAGTIDDDLHLYASSPCIEAGNNAVVAVGEDLDGNPRLHDADENGVDTVDMGAYEYDCVIVQVPTVPSDEEGYEKNRYISMEPGSPARQTALRVTLTDLPAPYDDWNGTRMWVQQPTTYCESAGTVNPPCPGTQPANEWIGATLGCEPWFANFGSEGVIHVFHEGTIPGATYDIQAIHQGCDVGDESNFSTPLRIYTSRWGDVVKNLVDCPPGPPDGIVGIPTDVTAVLNKFQNLVVPCPAVIKARADLDWETPDRRVDISDITCCLDAFRGFQYPPSAFNDPSPPPFSPGGACSEPVASGQ